MIRKSVILLVMAALVVATAMAERPQLPVDVEGLLQYAREYTARFESWRGPEFLAAKQMTTGIFGQINADPDLELMGIDENGKPIVAQLRNVNAALTTRTTAVRPGGAAGYNLDGSTTTGLFIWDQSVCNANHPELVGRVTYGDGGTPTSSHSSHTSGTLIASGVQANAKGMAVAAHLTSYNWDNDQSEMALAAAQGMKVSNHSYGFGSLGGGYDQWARGYDIICNDAPNYVPVIAAGNAGSNNFRTLYEDVCGKNSLAVGNVNDCTNYTGPGSVVINGSSSVGPTDDGRIKPDIVGNGTSLYSCSVNSYTTMTGTSMASPNIAGSLFLIYELYEQTHNGEVPWSSTIKAILFNTADECGPSNGPDYKYGWGLMNTTRACDRVWEDGATNPDAIIETMHQQDATDEYTYTSDGTQAITATICWIDPTAGLYANPALINDLDLVVENIGTGTIHRPWVLSNANPSAPATNGDNDLDNEEQVWIQNPPAGTYLVRITNEGPVQGGQQSYSLVVSGLTGGEAPDYLLTLTPVNNYIAPGGGELQYQANFRNNQNVAVPGLTYWNTVILPNGNPYGPVYSRDFTAQANMNVTLQLSLFVPGYAPAGSYEFIGNVGYYPNDVFVTDSFEMVKFGVSADRNLYGSDSLPWRGDGWSVASQEETPVRSAGLPSEYALSEAYPNPFNPATRFSVSLPEAAELTVRVYSVNGRLVSTLAEGRSAAGVRTLTFSGGDLASGVYFVTAVVPGELNATRKLVLVK